MFGKKKPEYRELKEEDYRQLKKEGGKKKAQEKDPQDLLQGAPEGERFQDSELLAENKSYLSLEDYQDFTLLAIRKKIKRRLAFWPVLSMVMALGLVAITLYQGRFSLGVFFLAAVLCLFSIIMLNYFFRVMPRRSAQSYRDLDLRFQGRDGGEPYKLFRFYQDGVATATSDGRHNTLAYEEIQTIYENDRIFAFALNDQAGYVLKKDSFQKGDMARVKEVFRAHGLSI